MVFTQQSYGAGGPAYLYKGFEIDPVAEPNGEGNGWMRVPMNKAVGFSVYTADPDGPKVDEFFDTFDAAKAWVDANGQEFLAACGVE